ncbi:two-component system, OmpR family, sensor histidine kinase KdpD [Paenibacillus sp. UNCCL117]|uniref:ATP-binding protein n=1 Tax=unclassified Paenibacillus TaxID=185978 RepID=UPI000880C4F7|nr:MULTISPECIES: ATP-binding protein [unclassified Paenibacillus]SDE33029.1 two-component system, OmpR family, sensor histidine kinase KdpD [Paenibacillus sp. cl123]SFW63935.1 two-component system, OmpR family, sensor histidine kinase KdpD [Paenibacillus sp. UNCCL117]
MADLKTFGTPWKSYAGITLLVAGMTAAMHPFRLALDVVNIALLFLIPVLLSAVLWGLRPSLYAAALGALAFDFFFVFPLFSFTVTDLRYLISFGVYLAVAALTASLAASLKRQLLYARQREMQTAALYEISRQISDITDIDALLDNISGQASRIIGMDTAIYLPDERNHLALTYRSSVQSDWEQGETEKAMAKLAFDHGEAVGYGTYTLRHSPGYYHPLRTEDRVHGVLAINLNERRHEFTTEQRRMLEALCGLAASAIDRVKLAEEAKIAHLTAESERLRTAILDSVSHELRTPLAAIIGSATGLIEGDHLFSSEDRMELLMTIQDGALRMNRLVVNLLSMIQLESGMLRLRKNWCDVEDLIGVAIAQVKGFQQHRKLRVQLPENIPMVLGDEVLLEQVLVNVISNAVKYSPDGSEIRIMVSEGDNVLAISVADQGIGLENEEYTRIFEKFYRAQTTRQVTGTGLGLAICKGIVELHHGTISGKRNAPQGTVITITLPLPLPSKENREGAEHE